MTEKINKSQKFDCKQKTSKVRFLRHFAIFEENIDISQSISNFSIKKNMNRFFHNNYWADGDKIIGNSDFLKMHKVESYRETESILDTFTVKEKKNK